MEGAESKEKEKEKEKEKKKKTEECQREPSHSHRNPGTSDRGLCLSRHNDKVRRKRVCKRLGSERIKQHGGRKKRLVYRNRVVVFLPNFKKSETSTSSISPWLQRTPFRGLTVILQSY